MARMIELENISKRYGDRQVLDRLNLKVGYGDKILIRGDNGCGKTTLLKIIVGQIRSYSGIIRYEKEDLRISSLIETPKFFVSWSAVDNLCYFLGKDELSFAQGYLSMFGLDAVCDRKVAEYSQGMKKKLLLVLALSRDCDLFLLDEPYDSLDGASVTVLNRAIESLAQNQKSTLVVSHSVNFSADMFTIYRQREGKLFSQRNDEHESVQYFFEFSDGARRDEAMRHLGLQVSELTEKGIVCLLKREQVSLLIRELSEYSLIQARDISGT